MRPYKCTAYGELAQSTAPPVAPASRPAPGCPASHAGHRMRGLRRAAPTPGPVGPGQGTPTLRRTDGRGVALVAVLGPARRKCGNPCPAYRRRPTEACELRGRAGSSRFRPLLDRESNHVGSAQQVPGRTQRQRHGVERRPVDRGDEGRREVVREVRIGPAGCRQEVEHVSNRRG